MYKYFLDIIGCSWDILPCRDKRNTLYRVSIKKVINGPPEGRKQHLINIFVIARLVGGNWVETYRFGVYRVSTKMGYQKVENQSFINMYLSSTDSRIGKLVRGNYVDVCKFGIYRVSIKKIITDRYSPSCPSQRIPI